MNTKPNQADWFRFRSGAYCLHIVGDGIELYDSAGAKVTLDTDALAILHGLELSVYSTAYTLGANCYGHSFAGTLEIEDIHGGNVELDGEAVEALQGWIGDYS